MPLSYFLNSRLIALPLRNPNFGIYTAGSAVSLVGMWMQRIAVGWLAWQLTGSGLWLGIVAFADFFPVVLVGPIAGTAADRWDRLQVVKVSQAISLALMPAGQGVVKWPTTRPALSALVDENELPLPDSAVDRVLLVHALEMTHDPAVLLREVWRVLASGGRLLAVVPNRRGRRSRKNGSSV